MTRTVTVQAPLRVKHEGYYGVSVGAFGWRETERLLCLNRKHCKLLSLEHGSWATLEIDRAYAEWKGVYGYIASGRLKKVVRSVESGEDRLDTDPQKPDSSRDKNGNDG